MSTAFASKLSLPTLGKDLWIERSLVADMMNQQELEQQWNSIKPQDKADFSHLCNLFKQSDKNKFNDWVKRWGVFTGFIKPTIEPKFKPWDRKYIKKLRIFPYINGDMFPISSFCCQNIQFNVQS